MPDQAKTVTLTIDGQQVTVPEGTTVLRACEKADSPVPDGKPGYFYFSLELRDGEK